MALTSVFSLHRSQFYLFFTDFRERSLTWTSSNSFFFSLSLSLSQKTEETQRHAAGVAEFHTVAEFQMTSGLSLSLSLSLSLATSLDTSGDGWNRWITGEAVFFSFFRSVGFGFFFFFVHALNQQRRLDDGANDVSDERQRKDIAALKKTTTTRIVDVGGPLTDGITNGVPAHIFFGCIESRVKMKKTKQTNQTTTRKRVANDDFVFIRKGSTVLSLSATETMKATEGNWKEKLEKKNSFRFSFFFF